MRNYLDTEIENNNPNYKAFRYTEQRWIDQFFQDGSLRLRPLTFYHGEQELGEVIGDSTEGRVTYFFKQQLNFVGIGRDVPEPLKAKLGIRDEDQNVDLRGFIINDRVQSDPCYIFSMSRIRSLDLANEFNYSGVFQVSDPKNFAIELSNAIELQHNLAVRYVMLEDCEYIDNNKITPYQGDMERRVTAALKPIKHANQREVRIIWYVDEVREFIDIKVPEARRFCKMITPVERP